MCNKNKKTWNGVAEDIMRLGLINKSEKKYFDDETIRQKLEEYEKLKSIVNEITTGLGGLKDGETLVDKIWDMRDELEDLQQFRNGRDE
jgi:hypothetical protein